MDESFKCMWKGFIWVFLLINGDFHPAEEEITLTVIKQRTGPAASNCQLLRIFSPLYEM